MFVLGEGPRDRHNKRTYHARCDCGAEKQVARAGLLKGTTTSCGCRHREISSSMIAEHGPSSKDLHGNMTPEFIAWRNMRRRCSNPNDDSFPDYGGRGIKVCEGWESSFQCFFGDVGVRPSGRHSIDRIDNELHYSCGKCEDCMRHRWPANCKWATGMEQHAHKRSSKLLTFGGETVNLAGWARRTGLSRITIGQRLRKGWSVEKALTTPPANRGQKRSNPLAA